MAKHSMRGRKLREYRKRLLTEAGYRCTKCDRPGKLEIGHIVPIAQGGDKWARSNLPVLCVGCHAVKSGYPAPMHVNGRNEWQAFIQEIQ